MYRLYSFIVVFAFAVFPVSGSCVLVGNLRALFKLV